MFHWNWELWMFSLNYANNKRKFNCCSAQVLESKGNNLHSVEEECGHVTLCSMPPKFRKNVWIKRGRSRYSLISKITRFCQLRSDIKVTGMLIKWVVLNSGCQNCCGGGGNFVNHMTIIDQSEARLNQSNSGNGVRLLPITSNLSHLWTYF